MARATTTCISRTRRLSSTWCCQCVTGEIGHDAHVILSDRETLRGFYNICLHRAGPVAYGSGMRQTLQCKYHGWTYPLDDSLLRAPEMDGVENFRPNDMHLL